MKLSNRLIRNTVFLILSLVFYLVWANGADQAYGKFVAWGVTKFTANVSDIERAKLEHIAEQDKSLIVCYYEDRATRINMEYCLPIVLLLAWQLSLFIDKRLFYKKALKLFAINFSIVYFIQILFPLLLYNVSQSKFKSTSLFIGMQIFGFIVFFLILKDSMLIKYLYSNKNENQLKP
jgi:hypothetical protein